MISENHSSKKRLSEDERRIAGFPSILLMNLAIIVAGCASGWNQILYLGVVEFLVSFTLSTLGYVCLTLCVAEMAGIIAFSGGSFGYVRCTLSPLIGFYCGVCDLFQTVFYTALFVHIVSSALAIASGQADYENYLPLWYLGVYCFILLLALPGGYCFWNSGAVVAVMSVSMLVFYCFMNIGRTDFAHFSELEIPGHAGTTGEFFATMQIPMLCYVGVDLITLFGEEAKEPQKNIPWSMVISLAITIFLAFWVILTCLSIHPGVSAEFIDKKILFPLHFAFEDVYGVSNEFGNLMMAPITFSTALGFMFAAGRQMYSMSKSGLLPAFLSKTFGDRKTPIAAMLTTVVIGMVALMIEWKVNPSMQDLVNISMGSACMVYVCMFFCFIMFRVKYGSMDRTFVNPLGIPSALYGLTYFHLVMMGQLFGQMDFYAFAVWVVLITSAMVYYFKVAEARQFFSKAEQEKFMKAYILNANRRKKQKMSKAMKMVLSCLRWVSIDTWLDQLPSFLKTNKSRNRSNSNSPRGSSPRTSSPRSISPRSSPRSKIGSTADREGDVQFVSTAVDPTPGLIPSLGLSIDTGTGVKKNNAVAPEPSPQQENNNNNNKSIEKSLSRRLTCDASQDQEATLSNSSRTRVNTWTNRVAPVSSSNDGAQAAKSTTREISWSGRLMEDNESRRFFEVLNRDDDEENDNTEEDKTADLVAVLPAQFSHRQAAQAAQGEDNETSEMEENDDRVYSLVTRPVEIV